MPGKYYLNLEDCFSVLFILAPFGSETVLGHKCVLKLFTTTLPQERSI